MNNTPASQESHIAIIGLACRFPGAPDADTYWSNLVNGVESIQFLDPAELEPSPIDPADVNSANYVRACAALEDIESFDAALFGYTASEATVMDPQHRIFLETAWQTLENAGYNPATYPGRIGVFGGSRTNSYLFNVYSNPEVVASTGAFEIGLGNDLAFLTSRVSHRLDLRGPSYSVHTACSTGLVAVHLACQSLLLGECDMALAGAVSVILPQRTGYHYQSQGILSPDGHCRVFDAGAQGTIFGSGAGMVLLKRAPVAIEDRDRIYAIIRGSATNNDGAHKASFAAPSVSGQVSVVLDAMAIADVEPQSISYIEAHGTGTRIGDPIEIRALTEAFRTGTAENGFCAIGSVKSNLGHLDAAAGMAGLIKVALALDRKKLPPTIHFERPNPHIDFENSPFRVNAALSPWQPRDGVRRAGVSAFGVGGTNAHVVLEEAPAVPAIRSTAEWQIFPLSARSPEMLDASAAAMAGVCEQEPEHSLPALGFTTQVGRKAFEYRRAVVCNRSSEAAELLRVGSDRLVVNGRAGRAQRPVVFLFAGQGAQYAAMGYGLYAPYSAYRTAMDECAAKLHPIIGFDIRELLNPARSVHEETALRLHQTAVTQPVMFAVEYSMARLLMSLGIQPQAMIGHSLGEYVAACCAGVFRLDDALRIVAVRGRLMQSLPSGSMLAVGESERAIRAVLPPELSVAAVNLDRQCVVSGPTSEIQAFAGRCEAKGMAVSALATSHAFHSPMMDPIVEEFEHEVSRVHLRPPAIPVVSNVTGKYLNDSEATSPGYWSTHLRRPVLFLEGLKTLAVEDGRALIEAGPGHTLSHLCRASGMFPAELITSLIDVPQDGMPEAAQFLRGLGKLWTTGVEVDWKNLHDEVPGRVALPPSPLMRQHYWLEAAPDRALRASVRASGKNRNITEWFLRPSWRVQPLSRADATSSARWLIVSNGTDLPSRIADELEALGHSVTRAHFSHEFRQNTARGWAIRTGEQNDIRELIEQLVRLESNPGQVVVFADAGPELHFAEAQRSGYLTVLYLARALAELSPAAPIRITAITNTCVSVAGERSYPESATLNGLMKVLPQESPSMSCRVVDIRSDEIRTPSKAATVARELIDGNDPCVALRRGSRWVSSFEAVPIEANAPVLRPLRERGVYLITGGLGGVGLIVAKYLATHCRARMVLLSRSNSHAGDSATAAARVRTLEEVQELGGEVLTVQANVGDPVQLRNAIATAQQYFGAKLNGVFHAAGVTAGDSVYRSFTEIGESESRAQFEGKALGCYALEQALMDEEVDFCVLFSSAASILGGLGYSAYAAANAFVDAFAESRSRAGRPFLSVNWDSWPAATRHDSDSRTGIDRYAMTEEEATEALRRAVCLGPEGQIAVITGDFTERRRMWVDEIACPTRAGEKSVNRTDVQSAFEPPRTDLERTIAGVWQDVLGVNRVGVNDSFFELGGHSLLATRMVNTLRDEFGVSVEIRMFFQQPTVAGMAAAAVSAQSMADRERAEILQALDELSDVEVAEELNRHSASAN